MNELVNDLWQNQRFLILAGVGFFAVTFVLTILMQFDSVQILGINRWIKPIKFTSSAAIFLLTTAVYLCCLQGFEKSKILIIWGTILIMTAEIFLIIMQAARGTTSHFNIAKPFDALVFAAMGLMILTNTLLVAYLALLYFRADFELPNTIVWGMRLGLILFLIGSIEGGYMASQTGHTVGIADGGSGLPFVNWSTVAGDLRVAHFLGLHALQIIPLFALAFWYLHEKFNFPAPKFFVVGSAVIYFGFFNFLFVEAIRGKPFISEKVLVINNRLKEFEAKIYGGGHRS